MSNPKVAIHKDEAFWSQYEGTLKALHDRWEPHDGQKPVLRQIFGEGKKKIFIRAGRKWGKTEISEYIAHRVAALFSNSVCMIVGPTQKQQKKIMWKNRRLQNFVPASFNTWHGEAEATVYYPNGSYIEIDGSENFEAHRGTEPDLVILDEFKDIDPRFYEAIYPNLLPRNGILVIIGTPPKHRDSFYYELEQQIRDDPDWVFIHAPTSANPHISKEWLEKEKAKYYKRGEGDVWEREFEARYVFVGSENVFPTFSWEKHVRSKQVLIPLIKADLKHWKFYITLDPGTTSVFAGLFVAHNAYRSQTIVLDEIYIKERSMMSSVRAWGEICRKKTALALEIGKPIDWNICYDEAAAWFANEIATQFGEGMTPSKKASINKDEGVSLFRDQLGIPNCWFAATEARMFIYEIENYRTNDKGEYPKTGDHCLDGYRYLIEFASITVNSEILNEAPDYTGEEESSNLEAGFGVPEEYDF